MKIRKNGKVVNLTESDLRRIVKKVISEQQITDSVRAEVRNLLDGDIDYNTIENLTDPKMILQVILQSIGYVYDDEAPVEAAFMAIEKGGRELYDKVNSLYKKELRTDGDLIDYVKDNVDITRKWHKRSIASMIVANKWDMSLSKDPLQVMNNEINRAIDGY